MVLSTKCLVAAGKFLVVATKLLFVVSNFVAVTKLFFPCLSWFQYRNLLKSITSLTYIFLTTTE